MESNLRIAAELYDNPVLTQRATGLIADFALRIPGYGDRPDGKLKASAWGKRAEVLRDLKAGDVVKVIGEIQSDAWVREGTLIPSIKLRVQAIAIAALGPDPEDSPTEATEAVADWEP